MRIISNNMMKLVFVLTLLSGSVAQALATVSCSNIDGNSVAYSGTLVVPADVPADTLLLEADNFYNVLCRVSAKSKNDVFTVNISDWGWYTRLDKAIDKNMYFVIDIKKRKPTTGAFRFDSRDGTRSLQLTNTITCKTSSSCKDDNSIEYTANQTYSFNYKVSLYKRKGLDMDWQTQPTQSSALWIADLVESVNEKRVSVAPLSIGGFNNIVWAECGVTLNPIPPVIFEDVNRYENAGVAGSITRQDVRLSVSKACNSANYGISLKFNPVQGTVLSSDKTMLVPAGNDSVVIRLKNNDSGNYITYNQTTKSLFQQLIGSGIHNASLSAELFWNPSIATAKRKPGEFTAAVDIDVSYY